MSHKTNEEESMFGRKTNRIWIVAALVLVTALVSCGPTAAPPAATTAPAAPTAAAGAPTTAAAAPTTAPAAPTTAPQPPATAAPKAPVVLRMARNAEPGPFVPWQLDDNAALFIMANVFDGLLRTTKDGASVEPALATKWEASADGLTWTFTL